MVIMPTSERNKVKYILMGEIIVYSAKLIVLYIYKYINITIIIISHEIRVHVKAAAN